MNDHPTARALRNDTSLIELVHLTDQSLRGTNLKRVPIANTAA